MFQLLNVKKEEPKSEPKSDKKELFGQIISNKSQVSELNNDSVKLSQKMKKSLQELSSAKKKREGLQVKKESDQVGDIDKGEEEESENDLFVSESLGVDLTVDSDALQQFDYNESVEEV